MPQMANITVKKADGTTDVTFTANVPSAGDKSPASWTQNSESARSLRPTISTLSQYNGPRDARRVSFVGKFPVVREAAGVPTKVATIPVEATIALPLVITDSEASEAAAQFANILRSTLMQQVLSSGYAPT